MSDPIPDRPQASRRVGPEVDIGLFSRVQQLIQSVRLTQDERVAVDTGDVASQVHGARKEFEMGHLEQTVQAVARFSSGFDQKVAQWESRARQREAQKRNLSMLQIRKMTAEHSQVRSRIELVRTQLRRLRVGLDQLENLPRNPSTPPELPGAEQPPPAEST